LSSTAGIFDEPQGAWIRVNPFISDRYDGKNEDVSVFRHLLVESDKLPKAQQWEIYQQSGLPITAVIDSAGSSLHAWVRIDAENAEQYKERAERVYETLVPLGFDAGNKNPSRFSRLPGAVRNGKPQSLIATNIGAGDWNEWKEESDNVGLPEWDEGKPFKEAEFEEDPQLVQGILSKGCKLVIGGPSKAKKTWVMIDLAISVANGAPWLSIETEPGKVLYMNFELKKRTLQQRALKILEAKRLEHFDDVTFWNLRGKATDIANLVDRVLIRLKRRKFDLIIVDPIYKCLGGRDENKANDMADFLNNLERLSEESGAAIALAAHFPKGNHKIKDAMDRIAGSGVFARDPNAIMTLTPYIKGEEHKPTKFEVDIAVREFSDVDQFRLEWQMPIMYRFSAPDKSSKEEFETSRIIELVELIPTDGVDGPTWQLAAYEVVGVKKRSFYNWVKKIKKLGLIEHDVKGKKYLRNDEELSELKEEEAKKIIFAN